VSENVCKHGQNPFCEECSRPQPFEISVNPNTREIYFFDANAQPVCLSKISREMSAHNTTNTAQAVCPHCGKQDDASDELGFPFTEEGTDNCLTCGKPFEWERTTVVTYTTRKPNTNTPNEIRA
jgi:DNA-directed RNA polymerase subunit RPC12/RpoP